MARTCTALPCVVPPAPPHLRLSACLHTRPLPSPTRKTRRQPALGPTNAIRLGLLRAKQAEAEHLRGVLAAVQSANAELAAQLAERRRQARELIAQAQPIAQQLEAVHVSSKAWSNRVVEPVG